MPQPSKENGRIFQQDSVVVVMGPTGTGKSTFIERATRQGGHNIGHKLRSVATDIRVVRTMHPTDHHPVVFVDTPGFNGPSPSDVDILQMIADFLVSTYKEKAKLVTIVYLHNISDNRMTGSLLGNIQTFASFCGQTAMPNVVIVTTMWDKVEDEEGSDREEELRDSFWKDMVTKGCKTERFDNTYESAWRIIGSVVGRDGVPSEIIDNGRRFADNYAHEAASKQQEWETFTGKLGRLFSKFRRNG